MADLSITPPGTLSAELMERVERKIDECHTPSARSAVRDHRSVLRSVSTAPVTNKEKGRKHNG